MLKKFLPVVLITVLALVLIGIKYYPSLLGHFSNRNSDNLSAKMGEIPNSEGDVQHRNKFLGKTFPFSRKEDEELAKKHPDQFQIVNKMYYSWDYIHNAQGEVEYGHPSAGDMFHVKFSVDFDKKKSWAKSEQLNDGKVIETENILLNHDEGTRQLVEKKFFSKEPIKNNPRDNADDLENYYLGFGSINVTNSQWYVLLYNNYSDWHYTVGTAFGMPVYQIEGKISYNISNSLAGPFTMTVSKDTGALLDLKCYGQANKVIESVTVRNIQINKGIPNEQKIFRLNVSGNRELSVKDFNLSGVGAQAVKGKK